MKNYITILFLSLISLTLFAQSETEPNDAFSSANTINFNATINGSINPAYDQDYFKFEVLYPGIIEINVSNVPSNIGMDVFLYDPAQDQIRKNSGGNGQAVFLEQLVCTPGIYYVMLEDDWNASNAGQYTLQVTFDNTDIYECNNTFSEAGIIGFGQPINASIRNAQDQDYFKFEVLYPGIIEINVSNVPSDIGMHVFLYDPAQDQISIKSGGNGQAVFLEQLVCTPGIYYVMLEDNGSASNAGQYTMQVTFDNTDIYECNNTFSEASTIELGQPINASIRGAEDLDYFKFVVPQAGIININVSNVPANIDMNVYLYNENQEQLKSAAGNNGQPVSFDFSIETPGIHYLLLTDNESNAEQYRLSIDFLTSTRETIPQISFTKITPNPFTKQFSIQSSSPIQSIQVLDATGNQIFFQKGGDLSKVKTTRWQSGIYFILIQTEERMMSRKLVKQ